MECGVRMYASVSGLQPPRTKSIENMGDQSTCITDRPQPTPLARITMPVIHTNSSRKKSYLRLKKQVGASCPNSVMIRRAARWSEPTCIRPPMQHPEPPNPLYTSLSLRRRKKHVSIPEQGTSMERGLAEHTLLAWYHHLNIFKESQIRKAMFGTGNRVMATLQFTAQTFQMPAEV